MEQLQYSSGGGDGIGEQGQGKWKEKNIGLYKHILERNDDLFFCIK